MYMVESRGLPGQYIEHHTEHMEGMMQIKVGPVHQRRLYYIYYIYAIEPRQVFVIFIFICLRVTGPMYDSTHCHTGRYSGNRGPKSSIYQGY